MADILNNYNNLFKNSNQERNSINFNQIEEKINNLLNNYKIDENDLLILNEIYILIDEFKNSSEKNKIFKKINDLFEIINNKNDQTEINNDKIVIDNDKTVIHDDKIVIDNDQTIIDNKFNQKIIEKNYELAYEKIPESLFECNMIYIEGQINSKKVLIFIDTGAQHSIIGYDKAKELRDRKSVV